MEPTQQCCYEQNRMRRAHSERQWPPRSFVLSVRARIAQGQREEAAGRVEALARRAQRGQADPPLRLSATGQTHAASSLASTALPLSVSSPHSHYHPLSTLTAHPLFYTHPASDTNYVLVFSYVFLNIFIDYLQKYHQNVIRYLF